MRLFIATVAVVMLASAFNLDRVVPTPLEAADRVADIVSAMRKALGGEDKVAALKGLSAEVPFRRSSAPPCSPARPPGTILRTAAAWAAACRS